MTTLQQHHNETMRIISEASGITIGDRDLADARVHLNFAETMARLDKIRDEPWPDDALA